MFVFRQNGCIREKLAVFGQSLFFSGNKDVFGKKCFFSGKVALFAQKWFYSGKSGCIRAIVVVFGQ